MLRIKQFREARALTQQALAELAEISIPYLSQLETGARGDGTKLKTLGRIADALGVHITEIFEPPTNGLSESEATRWKPLAESGLEIVLQPAMSGGRCCFKVMTDTALGLGFPRGTVLLIDMNRRARDCDAVVATLHNDQTGEGRTVIGRVFGGAILHGRFLTDPSHRTPLMSPGLRIRGVILGAIQELAPPD